MAFSSFLTSAVNAGLRRVRRLALALGLGVALAAPSAAPTAASAALPQAIPQAIPRAAGPLSAPAAAAAASVASRMAPRVLACTTCHGKEGRSTPEGYFPRLAGKPAGYLANQLLNFRDGRRSYPQMGYLLEHLSDDYLREMAAHFAALDLPYAPPPAAQAPATVLERGRQLVQHGDAARQIPACVQCHGPSLTGVNPAIPGLLGLPRDYLNSQLGAWTTGQRRAQAPDCMAAIARQLAPEDVSAVSAWLAAQPVPGGGKPLAQAVGPMPVRCGGVDSLPVVGAAAPVR
ncbi:MAG: c-type cytochrome [Burkholderiaceae bacterium]|nr:c-type cytochrome [Burkholderiaceae bacterium]